MHGFGKFSWANGIVYQGLIFNFIYWIILVNIMIIKSMALVSKKFFLFFLLKKLDT